MQSMHSRDNGGERMEKGERSAFSVEGKDIQAGASIEPLLRVLHEGVYIVDKDRRIQFWNSAAEEITGYAASAVVGSRCADNILRHISEDGRELCTDGCPLQATLDDGKTRDLVAYLHHRDGRRLPVHVRSIAMQNDKGIPRVIEVFDEISEKSKLIEELEALRQEVLSDPLTKIGNRRFFELNAEARLAAYHAQPIPFGLLMFDIDHFKKVNDTYGHLAGDIVLKMVAGTISGALRPLDTAARFGGEEFVVLVPNCTEEYLYVVGERIRILIETSWLDLEGGSRLRVTISGGGAMVQPNDQVSTLIERADQRLYQSKKSGRNRVIVGA
ncbi:MAG: sensor domain-containing diguanylate cyclase [Spirochaetia bacterium]|nr:sensor domain-containing diguanylate cyclase [Spirochaetia bacterium]